MYTQVIGDVDTLIISNRREFIAKKCCVWYTECNPLYVTPHMVYIHILKRFTAALMALKCSRLTFDRAKFLGGERDRMASLNHFLLKGTPLIVSRVDNCCRWNATEFNTVQ